MASSPFPSESASKGSPMQQKASLTRDEMKALQECNTESFWYRCVPLGVLFVGTTQILVKKRFHSTKSTFWSTV
ncbi:hypothetical protein LSAT2_008498 [Lamellibrachia satsuma]|nr:hypothetical protein LSAT2_008498 [Lamellibrachia satsuma]